MNQKKEIAEQTRLAFDFIQKLYLESSYLVKEIEGILNEESENFIIGKPSGYGMTTKSSIGLEANNVRLWLLRKYSVFFVEEDKTETRGGTTVTKFDPALKVLYLRLILDGPNISEPTVYSGTLFQVEKMPKVKWTKFENVMGYLEYKDDKIFSNHNKINYEDSYLRIKGDLIVNNLFDINNSNDIRKLIIEPSLKLYRDS